MAIQSINPATGEVLETFATLGRADIGAILARAADAQRAWARLPFAERARPMRRAGELLRERAEDLARLAALEMGKPVKEGRAEVTKCGWVCEHYADQAEAYLTAREIPTDASRSFVRYDPLGVILAVMPWNFPFWQVYRFFAPTLMAGNGGLLKHASNVPQCALAIEGIAHDAGFPRDLFRTLLIDTRDTAAVIEDPRVAAATLTGSEQAGSAVAATAGRALKPVVLELGGSDAFIVLGDADVPTAAAVGATARTMNGGQSCICAKRFIVVESAYDDFVGRLRDAMAGLRMGDPLSAETDLGPQARPDLRDELHTQVTSSVDEGAHLLLGGEVPDGPGAFYPATLLADVPRTSRVWSEETFGPVAAVVRVSDEREAIAAANDSAFGLGASLWSEDPGVVDRVAPQIEAGSVFVNGLVKSDPRLPFGGIKRSGFGRELGAEGIRAFVNLKTVWVR